MITVLSQRFNSYTNTLTVAFSVENILTTSLRRVASELFFSSELYPQIKWKLCVYPRGKGIQHSGYASVFLSLAEHQDPVEVDYKLAIRRENGQFDSTGTKRSLFSAPKILRGYLKFVELKHIKEKLVNGALIILCEIKYNIMFSCRSEMLPIKSTEHVPSQEDLMKRLCSDLASWQNSPSTDVIIQIGAQELKAHHFILEARSDVFCSMLTTQMAEGRDKVIVIQDTDYEVMKALLGFMYTSQTNLVHVPFALKVLEATDKYNLADLFVLCEHFICANMSDSSLVDALICGHLHNSERVVSTCIQILQFKRPLLKITNWDKLYNYRGILDRVFLEVY